MKNDFHFWLKTNAIPFTGRTFKSDIEYIVIMAKSPRTQSGYPQALYSKAFISSTMRDRADERKVHPTQKPLALMEKYVSLVCPKGGIVFDPFSGSGTTAVAAIKQGKRFVGCELEKKYFDRAVERIEQTLAAPSFFHKKTDKVNESPSLFGAY